MARKKEKKFIQEAIKRPGALKRRAKREGNTTVAQAEKDEKSGTPLEKKQANFFLKVLRPLNKKRSKRKSLLS